MKGEVDLRALGLTGLCLTPLFLLPFADGFFFFGRLDHFIVRSTLAVARGMTLAFGVTAITVATGVLTQLLSREFSRRSYWRAILIFAGVLVFPYLVFFLYAAVQLGSHVLAPFSHRASIFYSALGLAAPLVAVFASAWLYLRFKRDIADRAEWRRFIFLTGAAIVLSLPGFIAHLWSGIVTFTSAISPEPGYVYVSFVSWLSTLIGTVFTGFGYAFLFGLLAIYLLRRMNREQNLFGSALVMVAAALGIWLTAYGLGLLSMSITVGVLPSWDYWPTQEAAFALAILLVGAIAAGPIYSSVLQRALELEG